MARVLDNLVALPSNQKGKMSDKPTGEPMHGHYCNDPNGIGCNCKNEQQPDPTTGEWTAESIRSFAYIREDAAQKIADAHNAALAAINETLDCACDSADILRNQLAATLADQPAFRKAVEANIELTQQLAAERDERKTLAHAFESERSLRKRYEDQQQTLVDALVRIAHGGLSREEMMAVATEARAKVKDE